MYALAIRYRFFGPRVGHWQILPHAGAYDRLRDAVAELERPFPALRELPHGAYACDIAVVRVKNGEVVKVMYEK